MQCRKDLIGRRVVTLDRGAEVDRVKDVIVDSARNRVVALLLSRGGWMQRSRVVALQSVRAFGADAIMVPSRESIADVDKMPDIKNAMNRCARVDGAKLLSAHGNHLGVIRDLQFDERSGEVAAFEVSQGLLSDAFESRTILPAEGQMVLGADAVIVSEEAERELRLRRQAAKAEAEAPPQAAEAVTDVDLAEAEAASEPLLPPHKTLADYVWETVQQAGDAAEELWKNTKKAASELSSQAHESLDDQRIRRVLGLQVDRDIYADGKPIIMRGQVITPLAAAQARAAGHLSDLVAAATNKPVAPETRSAVIITDDKAV